MRLSFIFCFLAILASNAFSGDRTFCGPGEKVSVREKNWLIESVRRSGTGNELLEAFQKKFGSFDRLYIYWDDVSYSQLGGRDKSAQTVCIRLAKRLPDIEHIADFAHELTHAVRLTEEVLHGQAATADEFVAARLGAHGGEADAFATECRVKRDILGKWDELCSPFASNTDMNVDKVLSALKDGTLAASLTGEPYPVMLTRQYEMLVDRRGGRTPASAIDRTPASAQAEERQK